MAKSKAKPRPVVKSAATSKASILKTTRAKTSGTATIPSGGGGKAQR
jgi:hypothetical protein